MPYIIPFLAFLSAITFILSVSHAFLYLALRHFFGFGDTARWSIIVVLGFLSVSFIISSMIAHWYNTTFSRGFYYISSVWLGILSNAFFIFAILWILSNFLFFIYTIPLFAVGLIGITIVILSSLYGIINAANPVIHEHTVYIQNLPSVWEGKKLVQINDVHLGHIIRRDFAQRIVDMANKTHPNMVLIVGDLFDGMDGHLDGLIEPFNDFHSEHGTYFITGNHETYLGTRKTLEIVKKTNIRPIDNALINIDGLQFIGIASPEPGMRQDIENILKKVGYDRTKPSVLLYHTPTRIAEFRSLGISLQLAGHTHRGQLYPYNLITHLLFRGYDFGVYHEGDYTLSVSSGVGTWGPPMRTNNKPEIVVLKLTGKRFFQN